MTGRRSDWSKSEDLPVLATVRALVDLGLDTCTYIFTVLWKTPETSRVEGVYVLCGRMTSEICSLFEGSDLRILPVFFLFRIYFRIHPQVLLLYFFPLRLYPDWSQKVTGWLKPVTLQLLINKTWQNSDMTKINRGVRYRNPCLWVFCFRFWMFDPYIQVVFSEEVECMENSHPQYCWL